jgi:hypothetical protein
VTPAFCPADRVWKEESEQRYAGKNRSAFDCAGVLAFAQRPGERNRIPPTILQRLAAAVMMQDARP